jgi:hypothetical protein
MTVAMPSQSGGAAIQVANSSLGSGDGTTSNIVLRSVNNSASHWADAEYRASQHIFAIQGSEKVRISSGGLAINKNAAADAEIEIVQSADPTIRLHDNRNAAYKADFLMAGSAPVIRNNNTSASDRTLAVQKGTTDQFVINGDGSVNIGGDYTQTSRKLKVTTTGSSQLEVQGQEADIWMTSTGPGNTQWRILGSTGTTTHRWRVYDNTNNRDCINVYNNGSVVTPVQPGFFARRSIVGDGRAAGAQEWTVSGTGSFNTGSHFNASNGRFTAPIAGRYLFTAAPGYKQSGQNFQFYFRINNADASEPVRFIDGGDDLTSHSLASGSVIYNLSANDYVDVYVGVTHHVNLTTNYFMGYLLG